jgi:hypothetical protein
VHHPGHPEEKPASGRGRVIDASAVGHETLLIGAQIAAGIPLRAVAGEPGALITAPDPHLAQRHVGPEGAIALLPREALGGAPPVGCAPHDARLRPAEPVGLVPHGVWPRLAFGGGQHLLPHRLPERAHHLAVSRGRVKPRGRRPRSPPSAQGAGRRGGTGVRRWGGRPPPATGGMARRPMRGPWRPTRRRPRASVWGGWAPSAPAGGRGGAEARGRSPASRPGARGLGRRDGGACGPANPRSLAGRCRGVTGAVRSGGIA